MSNLVDKYTLESTDQRQKFISCKKERMFQQNCDRDMDGPTSHNLAKPMLRPTHHSVQTLQTNVT